VPTATQLTERYANFLLPVLSTGAGVCEVCGTAVVGGWPRCYQCNQAHTRLDAVADTVDFVALAVKEEQLAYELWKYKGQPSAAQSEIALRLAALLWRWLTTHEACFTGAAGCERFPLVTTVPSGGGRTGEHPLEHMVGTVIPSTRDRYRPLLRPTSHGALAGRVFDAGRWIAEPLAGEPILVVDDTWTTGSHVQSAAAALKAAGAGPVAVVSIGRHFQRQPADERFRKAAEDYYRASRRQGWAWGSCRLCWRPI
jgi:hypothetical protein